MKYYDTKLKSDLVVSASTVECVRTTEWCDGPNRSPEPTRPTARTRIVPGLRPVHGRTGETVPRQTYVVYMHTPGRPCVVDAMVAWASRRHRRAGVEAWSTAVAATPSPSSGSWPSPRVGRQTAYHPLCVPPQYPSASDRTLNLHWTGSAHGRLATSPPKKTDACFYCQLDVYTING